MLNGTLQGKGTWKKSGFELECTFIDDTMVGICKFIAVILLSPNLLHFIVISRFSNGVLDIDEMCGENHGKGSVYRPDGRIYNYVYRHGFTIALK